MAYDEKVKKLKAELKKTQEKNRNATGEVTGSPTLLYIGFLPVEMRRKCADKFLVMLAWKVFNYQEICQRYITEVSGSRRYGSDFQVVQGFSHQNRS